MIDMDVSNHQRFHRADIKIHLKLRQAIFLGVFPLEQPAIHE